MLYGIAGSASIEENLISDRSAEKRLNHGPLFNMKAIHDEADKLITKYTQKKIELLRAITDIAEGSVGVVLAGEPVLEGLLKSYDVRFANRMEFGYKLRGLTEQEVRSYFEGYAVDEDALKELEMRACNKQTGCFRLFDRTVNNVLRILKEQGGTRVTMKVVSEASRMMLL